MFNLYIIFNRLSEIEGALKIQKNISKLSSCHKVFLLAPQNIQRKIESRNKYSEVHYFNQSPLEAIELADKNCDYIFMTDTSEKNLVNRIKEQTDFMKKRSGLNISCSHFFISHKFSRYREYTNLNLLSFCFKSQIELESRNPHNIIKDFSRKNILDMPVLEISKKSALKYNLGKLGAKKIIKNHLYPLSLGYNFGYNSPKGSLTKNQKEIYNSYLDELTKINKKVKIVFLPFPGNGGADYSNIDIFKSKGFNSTNTICFYEGLNNEITQKQEEEYNSNFSKFFYLSKKSNRIFCPILIRELYKKNLIDEICVYASMTGYHYLKKLNSRKSNITNTIILHNRLVNGWMGESIKHLKDIDFFYVINDKIKRHIQCYGFNDNQIEVKYLDYRYRDLKRDSIKQNDKVIKLGFIGRLSKEKGISKLPDLAKSLKEKGYKDFEFHIIGSGSDTIHLLNSIGEYGLANHFKFHGYLKNPLPQIEKLSGLLIVSDVEGIPLVLMEAIALNVPVFSTPVGEVPEFKDLRKYCNSSLYIANGFKSNEISEDFVNWYETLEA